MKIRGIEGTKRRKSFQISGNTSKQGNKEAPISEKQPIYPNLIYSNNCKLIVKSVNTFVDLCYSEKDGKNPEAWENDSLIVWNHKIGKRRL